MVEVVLRACCGAADQGEPGSKAGPATPPAGFLVASSGLAHGVTEVVGTIRELDVSSAGHEAGHAVVGSIVGGRVERVSIRRQPLAIVHRDGLGPLASAAIDLAGPAAQAREMRHEHRRSDPEWGSYIPGVQRGTAGGCDICRSVHQALIATRLGDDLAVIAWLREVEGLVHEMVRSPSIWRAIEQIAARLRERGEVSGDEVAATVARHVPAAEIESWKRKAADVA